MILPLLTVFYTCEIPTKHDLSTEVSLKIQLFPIAVLKALDVNC